MKHESFQASILLVLAIPTATDFGFAFLAT
jgi:hypothetical protein